MPVALCSLHKLCPSLLTDHLQLLILLGRQDRFHLRVRVFVYCLEPLQFFRPRERPVVPNRL